PFHAIAETLQAGAGLDKYDAKGAIGRTETFLSLSKRRRRARRAFRQLRQSQRIVTEPPDVLGRKRHGQLFACGLQGGGELVRREPIGKFSENVRRLVEPEISEKFGGLI